MSADPRKPAPASGYYFANTRQRQDRAVPYSLMAAHGWEFLLDNHLHEEEDGGKTVKHAAVLGEN